MSEIPRTNLPNEAGRLDGLKYTDGMTVRIGFTYEYDSAGRLSGKAKLHGGWSESYGMDGAGRLTSFNRDASVADVMHQA